MLGIPTVLDRLIQQAVAQVLQAIWDYTFSEFSYGFRPDRSQHMAVRQARSYYAQGYRFIVDLDLEKFFDQVNHDRLMSRISQRVNDKRVLRLIGRYLRSGVMIGGLCEPTDEGTPQGGPLSPLLSNIVLDELDKEIEKRGLHFVRFADDIAELNEYMRGWWGYFSLCETRSCLRDLNAWVIRRLRAYLWKQWKLPRTRVRELINRGIPEYWAVKVGTTRKGPWRLSANTTVAKSLPVGYFTRRLGLVLPGSR